MKREAMDCLRCGGEMRFARREEIQLGRAGWLAGNLGNLSAGALEVEIYVCDTCGKTEFFATTDNEDAYRPRNRKTMICPRCGKEHPADDEECPLCGRKKDDL